jgi:uncharacterized membrane protein
MHQLADLSWWFSFFSQAALWWIFCLLASVAALPLCLRMFRGLADRGAGLATGLGVILTTQLAWVMGLQGMGLDPNASVVRVMILMAAIGFFCLGWVCNTQGYVVGIAKKTIYAPAAILGFIGIFALPHGLFTVWLALFLVAGASACCWLHDKELLVKRLREAAVPFIIAQVIFLLAFLFFVNVRSYIPWATFELSLYQAEKWGNFTHLNSCMTSSKMPPTDLWFMQQPVNYYYGGHLMMATIAKATGTSVRIAFNLGLATVFALTMSMGFSFIFSLVHLVSRKVRFTRNLTWHSGFAWAVAGMLAIAMFGNLDAWRQFLTRGVDYGVKVRWELAQREIADDWKLQFGIAPEKAAGLVASIQGMHPESRADILLGEIVGAKNNQNTIATEIESAASQMEQDINSLKQQGKLGNRQTQNNLFNSYKNGIGRTAIRDQNVVNSVLFEEELYRKIISGQAGEIPDDLRRIAKGHKNTAPLFEQIEKRLEGRMQASFESSATQHLMEMVKSPEYETAVGVVFQQKADYIQLKLEKASGEKGSHEKMAQLLGELNTTASKSELTIDKKQRELTETVQEAFDVFLFDPTVYVTDVFGTNIPVVQSNPTIDDLRFSWSNIAYVNFWDPSRAIKGTPPGVKEAGTITEFPYFSAILGDLHPHHMALPFSLAALCACLSFLRKNSRRKGRELSFWKRSWPELLGMAFFIGAVFSVNIWDAVVLSPLYGVVILIGRKDVKAADWWRWVGFAGYIILLAMVVGLFYNSQPGVAPLFQQFKLFLLGVMTLVPGYLILRHFFNEKPWWVISLVVLLGSCFFVFTGPFLSLGNGMKEPFSDVSNAIRDTMFFLVIVAVSAIWTLKGKKPLGNWWYAAGGIYALVGGVALAVILPFQLYFQSPLQPESKILYDLLPPMFSYELTSAANKFWEVFWKGSPVNPFPQNLRTDLRDFIIHWGLFVLPIMILAVKRFFNAGRKLPAGFPFMIAMTALAVMAIARNYLGYWVGSLSLGMVVFSAYYAVVFRRRADGPVWTFLVAAFFWTWFVEALHFNDDYAGHLERYNTPFKIYYPLWPIFAGGMIVAVRELFARFTVKRRDPIVLMTSTEYWVFIIITGIFVPVLLTFIAPDWFAKLWFYIVMICSALVVISSLFLWDGKKQSAWTSYVTDTAGRVLAHWPAALVMFFLLVLGMYYPLSATATRTREFFTWPVAGQNESRSEHRAIYTERTLDALTHLGEFAKYRQDYKAMTWGAENLPEDALILEWGGEVAYSNVGRMSTGSGRGTILGWGHHEHQWRGRAKSASPELKEWYFNNTERYADLGTEFQKIMGGEKPEIRDDLQQNLFVLPEEKRTEIFMTIYPDKAGHELEQLNPIVNNADGLIAVKGMLNPLMQIDDEISLHTARKLRLANKKERMEILNELFTDQSPSLMELYRLERLVEKGDLSMNHVMWRMVRDLKDMYFSSDQQRVAKLFDAYGIQYVVVGKIERDNFDKAAPSEVKAIGLEEHYRQWGFEEVYNSGEEQWRLDRESGDVKESTLIFKVPDSFAKEGDES